MSKKLVYEYYGIVRNGEKITNIVETKSKRQSKVLKEIEKDIMDNYKISFLDLVNFGFQIIN